MLYLGKNSQRCVNPNEKITSLAMFIKLWCLLFKPDLPIMQKSFCVGVGV